MADTEDTALEDKQEDASSEPISNQPESQKDEDVPSFAGNTEPQQSNPKQTKLSDLINGNSSSQAPSENTPHKLSDLISGYKGEAPTGFVSGLKYEAGAVGLTELTAAQRLWVQQQPSYNIIKAFGLGYEDSYKEAMQGTFEGGSEIRKSMAEGNYVHRGFVDSLVVPTAKDIASSGVALMKSGFSAAIQAPYEATQSALEEAGRQYNHPETGEFISGVLKGFAETPVGAEVGFQFNDPFINHVTLPAANGLIGTSEEVAMGLQEPSLAEQKAMNDASRNIPPEIGITETPIPEPVKTVHDIAREVDPQTFGEFDELSIRRDSYGRWLRDATQNSIDTLSEQSPYKEQIDNLQEKLETSNPRKTKIYQEKLDDLVDRHEDWIRDKIADDPAVSKLREAYQTADYRMRDLATKVSEAYREAESRIPKTEEIHQKGVEELNAQPEISRLPEESPRALEEPTTSKQDRITYLENEIQSQKDAISRKESADDFYHTKGTYKEDKKYLDDLHKSVESVNNEPPSIVEQKKNIADDVTIKLTRAGRPVEEANASAQLVAEHYQARSERFDGKFGTAEEMYKRDAADIEKAKQKSQEKVFARGAKVNKKTTLGKTIIREGGKKIIRMFRDANASTFIHETGHAWLEELMEDAKNKLAPKDIKKDAEILRKWFGAKEGEEISTEQHEKFARGFERFMMEGVAPSKNLVGIFSKFKDWLTKIYKTVENLNSPINDEIRGVFSRLLTNKPENAVIASERDISGTMAKMHETDAEVTAPEHAETTADNVRDELKEAAKDDENAKQAIRQAEETPRSTGNIPSNGPIGAGEAREAATIQQSPEVGGGGNETAAESPTVRPEQDSPNTTGTTAPKSGDAAGHPERRIKSEYLDKAGNIRLENLTTNANVKDAIRETYENNPEPFSHSVTTDRDINDLADAMGVQAKEINMDKLRQISEDGVPLAARIKVGRRMLVDAANSANEAAHAVVNDRNIKTIQAFAEARRKFLMIAETVSNVTYEWGLAGRAFRDVSKKEMSSTEAMRELFQKSFGATEEEMADMANAATKLKNPGQMNKFIQSSTKPNFGDYLLAYRDNCLLSGPITHIHYIDGNILNALYKPLTVAAASIGKNVRLGEAGSMYSSLTSGAVKGWKIASKVFTEQSEKNIPEIFKSGYSAVKIPNKFGGAVLNIPIRTIGGIHSFFKVLRYEQEINRMAYQTAFKEGLVENSPEFSNRMSDITLNPTQEMMDKALNTSLSENYMQKLDRESFMGTAVNLASTTLVGRFLTPFARMEVNVKKQGILNNTVLGLFSKGTRDILTGADMAARDTQIAAMTMGTAVAGVAYSLGDNINGSGPADKKQNAIWRLTHTQNSIQMGSHSIPFKSLGNIGQILQFTAEMRDGIHEASDAEADKMAAIIMEHVGRAVFEGTFIQSMGSLIDAIHEGGNTAARYISNLATEFVPFSSAQSQLNRAFIDPFSRSVHSQGASNFYGISDAIKSRIPVESQTLLPRRDIFGNPVYNDPSQNYDRYYKDPVVIESNRLGIGFSMPSGKIRGVQLDNKQYDEFSRVSGRLLHNDIQRIISSDNYINRSDNDKKFMISEAIKQIRKQAEGYVLMNNQDLTAKAMDNARRKRSSQ